MLRAERKTGKVHNFCVYNRAWFIILFALVFSFVQARSDWKWKLVTWRPFFVLFSFAIIHKKSTSPLLILPYVGSDAKQAEWNKPDLELGGRY